MAIHIRADPRSTSEAPGCPDDEGSAVIVGLLLFGCTLCRKSVADRDLSANSPMRMQQAHRAGELTSGCPSRQQLRPMRLGRTAAGPSSCYTCNAQAVHTPAARQYSDSSRRSRHFVSCRALDDEKVGVICCKPPMSCNALLPGTAAQFLGRQECRLGLLHMPGLYSTCVTV